MSAYHGVQDARETLAFLNSELAKARTQLREITSGDREAWTAQMGLIGGLQAEIDHLEGHEIPRLEREAAKYASDERRREGHNRAIAALEVSWKRGDIAKKLDKLFAEIAKTAAPLAAMGQEAKQHFWAAHCAVAPQADAANKASCDFSAATGHIGAVGVAFANWIRPLVDIFGASEFVTIEGMLPAATFASAFEECDRRLSRNLSFGRCFLYEDGADDAADEGADDDEVEDLA